LAGDSIGLAASGIDAGNGLGIGKNHSRKPASSACGLEHVASFNDVWSSADDGDSLGPLPSPLEM
jgi:hypothetical protein